MSIKVYGLISNKTTSKFNGCMWYYFSVAATSY